MNLPDVIDDLQAFADDESEFVADTGHVFMRRGGRDLEFELIPDFAGGLPRVRCEGRELSFVQFLAGELANLTAFSEKIVRNRAPKLPAWIDGPATSRHGSSSPKQGRSMELLKDLCGKCTWGTDLVFVTADAGHGKSSLLSRYQYEAARAFDSSGRTPLFWHIDLQGRQLLQLSEALMGDLGDLRVAGLWPEAIYRLVRRGLLVLAVDGFDELAAERGNEDALGALAHVIRKLEGRGTVLAASRSAFFDVDDYLRQESRAAARMGNCNISRLHLEPWSRTDNADYLRAVGQSQSPCLAMAEVNAMAERLGVIQEGNHPVLERPFLFTRVVTFAERYGCQPHELLRPSTEALESLDHILNSFIDREVKEKWKVHQTGLPYLTHDQHVRFLEDVASEMWTSQSETLRLDVLNIIMGLLLDEWAVPLAHRSNVLEMTRAHVLLVRPQGMPFEARAFDHPEFRHFFLAQRLARVVSEGAARWASSLKQLLSTGSLPESVAAHAARRIASEAGATIPALVSELCTMADADDHNGYIRESAGTLIPFLLHHCNGDDRICVNAPVTFSGRALQGLSLKGIDFEGVNLVNTSLRGSRLRDVTFRRTSIVNLEVWQGVERTLVDNVVLGGDCDVRGVIVCSDGREDEEYAPVRVRARLEEVGFTFGLQPLDEESASPPVENDNVKVAKKLLRVLSRSVLLTDALVNLRLAQMDPQRAFEVVIPLMVEHGILRPTEWQGGGAGQAWRLQALVADVLRDEASSSECRQFERFWSDLR